MEGYDEDRDSIAADPRPLAIGGGVHAEEAIEALVAEIQQHLRGGAS